jgi:hypothetical protein
MSGHLPSRYLTILLLFLSLILSACSTNQQSQNTNTPGDQKALSSAPPRYDGYLDIANCDGIHGWVWDQNQPNTPLSVEIYDGNTLLVTMKADELRENLVSAGKGNGMHAYTYVLPPALKDDKPHSIRVKIAGTNFELGNSPKPITCTFQ